MKTKNRCVIYARYSTDDEIRNEQSRSITNQIEILTERANERGFEVVDTYYDYMYSGKDFNRPNIKRLFEDAKKDKFDILLLKDLSRFGRNYIDVGTYIQEKLLDNGIRVISINDNYDSDVDFDFLTFAVKNFFNEFYIKDVSRKIRRIKARMGKETFLGNRHYGYIREDDQFKIYKPEANVIKLIFEEAKNGKLIAEINEILTEKKIDTPTVSFYKKMNQIDKYEAMRKTNPNKWSNESIRKILVDDFYTGTAVNFKTDDVKSTDERNIVFENHHKAIVSKEDLKLMKERFINKNIEVRKENLHRMIFCKKCLSKFNLKTANSCLSAITKDGKVVYKDYQCDVSYPVEIMNSRIYDMLLNKYEDIKNHKNEYISEITKEKYEETANLREIALDKRKYEAKMTKLFELYTDGNILIDEYKKESVKLNNLIKDCNKKLSQSSLDEYKIDDITNKVNKFLNHFYKSDDKLDVIREFVSKALYDPDKGSIDIILKFEEELDVPSSRLSNLVKVKEPTLKDFNLHELVYEQIKNKPHIKAPEIVKEVCKIFPKFTLSNVQRSLRILRMQDRIIFEGKADLVDGYVIKEYVDKFDYKGLDLNTKDKIAYRLLWNNPKMSYNELSEALDTSLDRTRRIVKKIRRQGGFEYPRFDKSYTPEGCAHSIFIENPKLEKTELEQIRKEISENPDLEPRDFYMDFNISKASIKKHVRRFKEEFKKVKKEEDVNGFN